MPEFGNTSRMKDFIVDHLSLHLSNDCAGAGRAVLQRISWCSKFQRGFQSTLGTAVLWGRQVFSHLLVSIHHSKNPLWLIS